MSKNTRYEMAAAYVSVLPSLEGLAKELERQISAATPKLRRDLNSAFSQGASGAVGSIGRVLNGASSVFTSGGKAFGSLLLNGVNSAGSAFAASSGRGRSGAVCPQRDPRQQQARHGGHRKHPAGQRRSCDCQ